MRPAIAIALVALLTPLALAQGHQHQGGEGMAFVLHDGPDDGRAVVGGLTRLGFALLEDGVPQVHRDASFTVVQNGRTIFATTDAHEYDGVFSLDLTFTEPGPYEVRAESEGMMAGVFQGVAVAPANATEARVELDVEGSDPLAPVRLRLSIVDGSGAILDHTDAVVETRDARGRLVSRAQHHIHDEPIRWAQRFPAPGDYVVHVEAFRAFPTGRSADLRAVVADFPVTAPAPLGVPEPFAPAPHDPLEPAGMATAADGLRLQATVDPQPLVGLGSPVRFAAVVVDANGTPVPHVDFRLTLTGPNGAIYDAPGGDGGPSLHEYDGAFEFVHVPWTPGAHRALIQASRGDATLQVEAVAYVAPPAAPLDAGAFRVSVAGLEGAKAHEPATLVFSVKDDAGRPLAHSEVDVAIFHEGEAAVYRFKLHTHDSGDTSATVVFPHGGGWTVAVDPFTLMPQASLVERALFAVEVAPGEAGADVLSPAGGAENPVPAPAGAWIAAALAAAAVLARRRA